MGDFVDRGFYSVETFLLLLALKVRKMKFLIFRFVILNELLSFEEIMNLDRSPKSMVSMMNA